jgi:hypothetical protein
MNEMNELPKMTDQEVVDLVCELRPAAAPGSLGANLDVSPADYSRLNTAQQELVDRGYTEMQSGCWQYEDDPDSQLTCDS